MFFVPHSLSISDHLTMLCVADRENSRLQCFDLEGQYKFMVNMEKKAFGIVFKPKSGTRHLLVGRLTRYDHHVMLK